jgi:hypothetical protein
MVVGMVPSSTPSSDVSDTIAPTATMRSDKRWDDYPPRDKLSQGVQSAWDLPSSRETLVIIRHVPPTPA